jgi:hypothetical protein
VALPETKEVNEIALTNSRVKQALYQLRTHAAVQVAAGGSPGVPNPPWGEGGSDRLDMTGTAARLKTDS